MSVLLGLQGIHAYLLQTSAKQAASGDRYELMDCRVLDSSEHGMKLFVGEGGTGDARVGDLLGIIEGGDSQETLRLASVRSVRVLEQGGVETGVEMIGGGAGAVYCRLPEQADATNLLALFLPAEEEANIAATLVVGSGMYERDRALQIDVGGREIRIRAGRMISNSPVFDRFEFTAE